MSAPCRNTALHLASCNGHTESVTALLEKGAAVNAADDAKCAFFLFAVLDGRRLPAPAKAVRPFRLVGERVGAMQGDGATQSISEWPHGEREGAAREGRGRERRGQSQVRVFSLRSLPVLEGRRLPTPAKAVRPFWLVGERFGAMQGDGAARRI
jgi:hypothetical protein